MMMTIEAELTAQAGVLPTLIRVAIVEDERDIRQSIPLVGVFPIGRLDKDSNGLIILTDDGRITDKLLKYVIGQCPIPCHKRHITQHS